MMSVHVPLDIVCRPLRFAFCIDVDDPDAFLSAVEMATAAWGGLFAPIIPVFTDTPPAWDNSFTQREGEEVTKRMFAFWHPEVVFNLSKTELSGLVPADTHVEDCSRLFPTSKPLPLPIVLDCSHLFHSLAEEQDKVRARRVDSFVLPEPADDPHAQLMSAAVYGRPSQRLGDYRWPYLELYRTTLRVGEYSLDAPNVLQPRLREWVTPIGLTAMGLDCTANVPHATYAVAVVRPGNVQDCVDFWNLRAIGVYTVPFIEGSPSDSRKLIEQTFDFHLATPKDRQKRSHREQLQLFAPTTATQEERQVLLDDTRRQLVGIELVGASHSDLLRSDSDFVSSARPPKVEERTEHVVAMMSEDGQLLFNAVPPRALVGAFNTHNQAWANVVRPWVADLRHTASIPVQTPNLGAALKWHGHPGPWSVPNGVAFSVNHGNLPLRFNLPSPETAASIWFRQFNVQATLSDAGLVANSMTESLGRLSLVRYVTDLGLPEILNKMAGEQRVDRRTKAVEFSDVQTIDAAALFQRIHTAIKKAIQQNVPGYGFPIEHAKEAALNRLKFLTDNKVIRLVANLQCTHCTRRTWFKISELDYSMPCRWCMRPIALPSHDPKQIKWKYVTAGPFSVPNYAKGSYAVLSTLSFLDRSFRSVGDNLCTPSMTLKFSDSRSMETDFFFAHLSERDGRYRQEQMLGECKSGEAKFDEKDFKRAHELLEAFTSAGFVFATSRAGLSAPELNAMRELATRRPYTSRIAVLCSNELQGFNGDRCWESHEDAEWISREWWSRSPMSALASITQRVNLQLTNKDYETAATRVGTP